MGKRGRVRLDMKGGKIFRRSRSSGLERSGDVHIRMYTSSASLKASSPLEVKGIYSSCKGLDGPSCLSDPDTLTAGEVSPED